LMFYDALALRHMRKTLPFRRVALASFTSYAFTHSFGFGSLMHATIRYRLYAPPWASGPRSSPRSLHSSTSPS
jgi:phosphatidylglycerol lysyltransferase